MELWIGCAEECFRALISQFAIPIRFEVAGTNLVDFSCCADIGEVKLVGTDANNGACKVSKEFF